MKTSPRRPQGVIDEVRIQNGAVRPSAFNLLSKGAIPSETAASLSAPVEILVRPNPVSSAPAVLEVSDPSVACISAYIYALSGHLVFPRGWLPGSRAEWDLQNSQVEHPANGVYLFIVVVRDVSEVERESPVGKLFLAQ